MTREAEPSVSLHAGKACDWLRSKWDVAALESATVPMLRLGSTQAALRGWRERIAVEKIPYRGLTGLGSRVASRTDFEPIENEDISSSFTSHGFVRLCAGEKFWRDTHSPVARTPWTGTGAVVDLW
jgi:hypothetical protein